MEIDHAFTKKPVLVVEDNPLNQNVIVSLLKKTGCQRVDIAPNGLEALNMFINNDYCILFMDCQMPVMDGFESAERIRQHELDNHHARTPIIAVTADVIHSTYDRCIKSGMDAYIGKPVKLDMLVETLAQWT
jgi:CheY-like chemotaxis protein